MFNSVSVHKLGVFKCLYISITALARAFKSELIK